MEISKQTRQKLEGFLAGLTCSGDSPYEQGTKEYINWLAGKFLSKAGNNQEKAEQVLIALFNMNGKGGSRLPTCQDVDNADNLGG